MEAQPSGADDVSTAVEAELRGLSEVMTRPLPRECLVCYVWRMLELGCNGTRWMHRYQQLRAPRATALEARMARLGAFCDCELLMNAVDPNPLWFTTDEGGEVVDQPVPRCLGVRAGSTRPCMLWFMHGAPWRYG